MDQSYKQASSLDFLQMIEEGLQEVEGGGRAYETEKARQARAFAEMCAAMNLRYEDLSDNQRAFADAIIRRNQGDSTESKGFGFSIPTEGRKPNVKF